MTRAAIRHLLFTIGAAVLLVGPAAAGSAREPESRSGEFRQGPGLFAIAAAADAIVIGAITGTHDSGFDIRVERRLRGDVATGAAIKVEKSTFEATDPRWAPYATGQTLVLFLERPKAQRSRWRVLGLSGEGELPSDGKFVYLTGHFVKGLAVERYSTMGGLVASQRIAKADFIDAIDGLFACFRMAGGAAPRPACDRAALAEYAARSPLHGYLARAGKGS